MVYDSWQDAQISPLSLPTIISAMSSASDGRFNKHTRWMPFQHKAKLHLRGCLEQIYKIAYIYH